LISDEAGVRVGIFGGTFDPIHQGHLIIAEQVADTLSLARVVFVPGGVPPHKEASSVKAPAEYRLEMVERAVEGNERFVVDRIEVDARRKMYSIETVPVVKRRHEGGEWFFISGADEVSNLLSWKQPDRFLEEVRMVAATRPGYDLSHLDRLAAKLENFDRIVPVECTRVDISSTEIRRMLAEGRSVRYLVPEGVHELIRDRGLYGAKEHARKRAQEGRLNGSGQQ
jgi:nicotinate-nucleotide adenylyltransferase